MQTILSGYVVKTPEGAEHICAPMTLAQALSGFKAGAIVEARPVSVPVAEGVLAPVSQTYNWEIGK